MEIGGSDSPEYPFTPSPVPFADLDTISDIESVTDDHDTTESEKDRPATPTDQHSTPIHPKTIVTAAGQSGSKRKESDLDRALKESKRLARELVNLSSRTFVTPAPKVSSVGLDRLNRTLASYSAAIERRTAIYLQHQFIVIPNDGGGDCLLRSVSQVLTRGSDGAYEELREMVYEALLDPAILDLLYANDVISRFNSEGILEREVILERIRAYAIIVRQPHEPLDGDVPVNVMALKLNRRIIVWNYVTNGSPGALGSYIEYNKELQSVAEAINILHTGNYHYEAMLYCEPQPSQLTAPPIVSLDPAPSQSTLHQGEEETTSSVPSHAPESVQTTHTQILSERAVFNFHFHYS